MVQSGGGLIVPPRFPEVVLRAFAEYQRQHPDSRLRYPQLHAAVAAMAPEFSRRGCKVNVEMTPAGPYVPALDACFGDIAPYWFRTSDVGHTYFIDTDALASDNAKRVSTEVDIYNAFQKSLQ